ncbi:TlpA family protein disulfide reductase [Ideonella sp. 4Y11]|uniref:TlpA family protein disulfide reductase n=1 Tax=Ideonella aquatica TaxID=2824119 RepID=A0A940YH32_9BURK|nr:TlpA disulfide reductase family protein [Ideonella aquatica]MBQ0959990.1 TlpA family protein disulfide reductase [Ideonella aquatica]
MTTLPLHRRGFLTLPLLAATPLAHANLMDWFNGISLGQRIAIPELAYLDRRPRAGSALTMWYFWATWCEPCRETFPLLNEWRRSEPGLEIIAVTDEDAGKVSPFVAKVPVELPIALDTRRQLFDPLRVRGVPYAMTLNRQSVVTWRGQPKELTTAQLKDLLSAAAG